MPVINKQNSEHYTWGDGCDGWRLLNGSDVAVIEERIPPGRGEIKHYHSRARQLFYVLLGQLKIETGSETEQLSKGDSREIAPGLPHRVWNPFYEDACFLVISAPSTKDDRVNLEPPPSSRV